MNNSCYFTLLDDSDALLREDFLSCRGAWLQNSIYEISNLEAYQYLDKLIEIMRSGITDTVTLYKVHYFMSIYIKL